MGFYKSALFEKLERKYSIGMICIATFLVFCSGQTKTPSLMFIGIAIFGFQTLHKFKGGKD